jgi:hypothetical protein
LHERLRFRSRCGSQVLASPTITVVARAAALQQSLWGLGRRAAGSLSGRDPFRQVRPPAKLAPDERPATATPPCGRIWVRSPASFGSVLAQVLAWKSVWQFWCTYTHSVLGWSGPAQVMSDLVMLQRLAERAVPPGSRAEGLEKWRKWQFLECVSSICTPV